MSELIDQDSRTWDEGAVRECCYPHDAAVILNIKIPTRATDDFIAWSGESNGTFSVRLMSTNASTLVDSIGPPSAEVCRTAASFP